MARVSASLERNPYREVCVVMGRLVAFRDHHEEASGFLHIASRAAFLVLRNNFSFDHFRTSGIYKVFSCLCPVQIDLNCVHI